MKGRINIRFMSDKNRTWILVLGLFLLVLINFLLSELLIILESNTSWYANYDVELTNLIFLVKVLSSIIVIFYIKKIHSNLR